jgi:hypothetical protein
VIGQPQGGRGGGDRDRSSNYFNSSSFLTHFRADTKPSLLIALTLHMNELLGAGGRGGDPMAAEFHSQEFFLFLQNPILCYTKDKHFLS